MRTLRLIHPVLGLCSEIICEDRSVDFKTRNKWKKKYGKKFMECTIEVVKDKIYCRQVVDLKTEEVYPSAKIAAGINKMSAPAVRFHCNKKATSEGFKYRFKWL